MAKTTRRGFLKVSAWAGVASVLPGSRRLVADQPESDIRIGVIGIRSRGSGHLQAFGRRVAAICDVDETILSHWKERLASAKTPLRVDTYTDFRKLLERPDLDAVSIATPNHTHALIAILAAQAGKHVYVEKPVSQTIWEGRQLASAARKYQRVIQCGTQARSSRALQTAQAFVREGRLGTIQYAIGTCYKRRPSIGKLSQPLSIPKSIDYDLWCGPVEKHQLYRPQLHYDWHWDFHTGNGDLGNQGVHQMDIARWFLGYDQIAPRTVSFGGRLGYEDAGNTPNTQVVFHDYPTAPILFEVRGLSAAVDDEQMDIYRGSRVGVIVQCEKGHLLIPSYSEAVAYDNQGQQIEAWKGEGEDQEHCDNFLAAMSANDPSLLNAEVTQGHLSSALCHTGNVSYQMGQPMSAEGVAEAVGRHELLADSLQRMIKHLGANGLRGDSLRIQMGASLEWDPATETVTNLAAANQRLHRKDRAPFAVPSIA